MNTDFLQLLVGIEWRLSLELEQIALKLMSSPNLRKCMGAFSLKVCVKMSLLLRMKIWL